MAKLMVMIDIPNYDYDELREMMEKKQTSTIPGLDFSVSEKSKDGYSQVAVLSRYLQPLSLGNVYFFELIGVRP